MKKLCFVIWLFMLSAIAACGGGTSENGTPAEPAVRELQIGETASAMIETKGDVDTYHFRAAETNRFLNINCREATSGSPVDLLVTVFEETNGQRVRLFGKHKPDGATLSADLDLWIFIDSPKDLYITVRDLMDDDASTDIPYNLTVTFQDSMNGNHDFSNAQPITIGAGAITDAISKIGEVDCFTFEPQSSGVFSVDVVHNKPGGVSPVQLALSLYDHNGNLIQRLSDPHHTILSYLEPADGPFFVIVEDNDSMNGDDGAPYDLTVGTVTVAEAQGNDTIADATFLAPVVDTWSATGAIDYGCASLSATGHAGDVDWYALTIGAGGATFHQIELSIDGGGTTLGTAPVRVTVYDTGENVVTSYDFSPNGGAYLNHFRAQDGQYFVSVAPVDSTRIDAGVNYRVQLREVTLNDTAEENDDNTKNTAIAMNSGDSVVGYVSYHSDVDWYQVDVSTDAARVLSVDFTAPTSIVDYQVSIWRGENEIKRVTDMDGSDGVTHLKTSILVPGETPAGTAAYHVKVCDAQNNEGSDVAYTLSVDVAPVPGAPAAIGPGPLYYYDEPVQEAGESQNVELEIFSTLQPVFKANTDWLDFRNNQDITMGAPGVDGSVQIDFPWISGYIDYQGDRDFFQLDFDKLDPAGAETSWYYDIAVHLVVPDPGSDVEYVWKLYRDRNSNATIMDNPSSPDGYIGCAGDLTPQNVAGIDMTTPDPAGSDQFWVGSQWGAGAQFYFSISDFNYLQLPAGSPNPDPDDDWGYAVPYYFKLTLTYHPGQSAPN